MLQLNPDKGLKNNKHEKQIGLSFKIKTISIKLVVNPDEYLLCDFEQLQRISRIILIYFFFCAALYWRFY